VLRAQSNSSSISAHSRRRSQSSLVCYDSPTAGLRTKLLHCEQSERLCKAKVQAQYTKLGLHEAITRHEHEGPEGDDDDKDGLVAVLTTIRQWGKLVAGCTGGGSYSRSARARAPAAARKGAVQLPILLEECSRWIRQVRCPWGGAAVQRPSLSEQRSSWIRQVHGPWGKQPKRPVQHLRVQQIRQGRGEVPNVRSTVQRRPLQNPLDRAEVGGVGAVRQARHAGGQVTHQEGEAEGAVRWPFALECWREEGRCTAAPLRNRPQLKTQTDTILRERQAAVQRRV
jgi:hypothetical protein